MSHCPIHFRGDEAEVSKCINTEVILRLQEEGIAVLSDTTVKGRHCLRAAITNHRARRSGVDMLVRELVRIYSVLLVDMPPSRPEPRAPGNCTVKHN